MPILIVFNRPPYDEGDATWNSHRLVDTLHKTSPEVRLFLMNDAVDLARDPCRPPAETDAYTPMENHMLIAVPSEQGRLAEHFGRCRQVALFDVNEDLNTAAEAGTLDMPPHEPGAFPAWLSQHGVGLIIAGGMGVKALRLFEQTGIQVLSGQAASTPQQLIVDLLAGRLTKPCIPCHHEPDHPCDH